MKNVLHPKIEQIKEEKLNSREAKGFPKKIIKGNPKVTVVFKMSRATIFIQSVTQEIDGAGHVAQSSEKVFT